MWCDHVLCECQGDGKALLLFVSCWTEANAVGHTTRKLRNVARSECQRDGNSTQTSLQLRFWLRDGFSKGLRAAFRLRREWLPAGALRRELVDDAEVRHSGARCHRLHAVVRAVLLLGKFVTVIFHEDSTFRLTDRAGDGVLTDQRSHNHCDCTEGHSPQTRCRFVCLCVSRPTVITRRPRRVLSTMSTSPCSSARASLVFTCQDTCHKVPPPSTLPLRNRSQA